MIKLIVPPQKGGVHDFSTKLLEILSRDAADRVFLQEADPPGLQISPDDVVILQFSGYGFKKRGAPLWLLREIERHRKNMRSLGIFFHELYAFGPPWSSSFWLSPVQRHIARRLAELSDFWMTNREGSAQWLRKFAGHKPHAVLPVFSNVGEATRPPLTRSAKVVVFGSPGVRERTYQAAGGRMFAWARAAGLAVHDVGSPVANAETLRWLDANGVIQHGRMEESDISDLLQDASFGVLAYPVAYAAKSGVFAAYVAHGVCPILFSNCHEEADGLKAGIHYLPGLPDADTLQDSLLIGQAAWGWYQPHKISRHTEEIKRLSRSQELLNG